MSSYSLDSLEKYSNNESRAVTKEKNQSSNNPEIRDKFKDRKASSTVINSPDQACQKGKSRPANTEKTLKVDEDIGKFKRNAIITSGKIARGEFCSSVEKLPVTVGTRTHFRTGRPIAKKFNVPRGRSSSLSLSEFRHDSSSLTGKRPADVAEFMKADKKLGNVQPSAITDRSKKPVSYLEFYHRRFAAGSEKHHCTYVPLGSNVLTGEVGPEKRPTSNNDSGTSLLVSRVEDFHHPELQLIESREPSESRSCEAFDSFVTKGREFKGSGDNFTPGCFSDAGQPINRQRRVSYKPYGIEDYRSLGVSNADRSLGPDRHEMERKGEWLLRRRTYGDSVSALNRQRILRRAEKLKDSRRSDSEKPALDGLASMDVKHGGPASKDLLQQDKTTLASSPSDSEGRKNLTKKRESVSKIGKSSPSVRKKVSALNSSKSVTKARASNRVNNNLYETSSDTLDDESMNLKKLRQRHLEEKIMIDRLLRRGLYS